MKFFNFEGFKKVKKEPEEVDEYDSSADLINDDNESLIDPLEAGHRAADELMARREEKRIEDVAAAKEWEEIKKNREEDLEDLEKTYRRF